MIDFKRELEGLKSSKNKLESDIRADFRTVSEEGKTSVENKNLAAGTFIGGIESNFHTLNLVNARILELEKKISLEKFKRENNIR